jgi:hypothetical protein
LVSIATDEEAQAFWTEELGGEDGRMEGWKGYGICLYDGNG